MNDDDPSDSVPTPEPTGPSVLIEDTSPLLAWLQLVRIPNVSTAVADVLMGYLVTRGGIEQPVNFVLLIGASCLLYMAGMALNDVYDIQQDTEQRPHRPIPSGRISWDSARTLGFGLLTLGMACGWFACITSGMLRPGLVATALAAAIVLYDRVLKKTPLAPVAMGSCRALNVLLGMSVESLPWTPFHWLAAAGVGVYIVGVTWFARTEAKQSSQLQLAAATFVSMAGVFILARTPIWAPGDEFHLRIPYNSWHMLWVVLALLIGWRMLRAVTQPEPRFVQPAVKVAIMSLIVLDAAMVFGILGKTGPAGLPWAFLMLLLILPTMFLGRWIYST